MKRTYLLVLLLSASMALFSSCKDDDKKVYDIVRILDATPKKIEFYVSDVIETYTVELTYSNVDWEMKKAGDWFAVEKDEKAGESAVQSCPSGDFTITIKFNVELTDHSNQDDSGTITFKGEGVDDVVIVVEKKARLLPETVFQPDRYLLSFDADAGSDTINISFTMGLEWEVSTTDEWLSFNVLEESKDDITKSYPGVMESKLSITASPNYSISSRTGKLTVRSTNYEEFGFTVTVEQDADSDMIWWDRSSLRRMNLHGKVKSVDYYSNILEGIEMWDLEFNENGMLTKFLREKADITPVIIEVDYDDSDRITSITGKSTNDDFVIEIGYGSHGKYIATEELFIDLAFEGYHTEYMAWIPLMIKDLSKVTVKDNGTTELEYVFKINGEKIELELTDSYGTDVVKEYTFDGPFTHTVSYTSWFWTTTSTYVVDGVSGKIRTMDQTDEGEEEPAFVRTYNDDRINSMASVIGEYDSRRFTYDDNLDLIAVEDLLDSSSDQTVVINERDLFGNWTEITWTRRSGVETIPREFIYN